MKNKGLGKGLSVLLGEYESVGRNLNSSDNGDGKFIDIDKCVTSEFQPRVSFCEDSLKELCESIKSKGVLQPIIVRKTAVDTYEIIAGERRWRAAKMAGLDRIPVIVKNIDDEDALEIALLENIQRENLSPVEEAEAYDKLMKKFNYTQLDLSEKLGKSRSYIANILRLNNLSDKVKSLLNDNKISVGHAKMIVGHVNAEELANDVIANKLTVRQLEDNLRYNTNKKSNIVNDNLKGENHSDPKDNEIVAIENGLAEFLGMKVSIDDSPNGGKLTIYFHDIEQLDRVIQKITG